MAKIKKATRKFQAKGGATAMLKKGTITKKGKLKRRKVEEKSDAPEEAPKVEEKEEGMNTGKELGEMDIDQFLNEDFLSDDEEDYEEEEELRKKMEDSASDNDDDDKVEENDDSASDSDSEDELDEEKFKLQLASMAEKDPDFMKHLEENDPSLLESAFAENDDDEEEDMDEGDDDEEEEDEAGTPAPAKPTTTDENQSAQTELTSDLLSTLSTSAYKSNSLKSLKRLMTAYMSASRMGDVDSNQSPYYIPSEKVYSELLKLVLGKTIKVVYKHLKLTPPESPDTPIPPKSYTKSTSWPKIQPILQSFFRSTSALLKSSKSNDLLLTVLQALKVYVQLCPDEKTGRGVLKSLVGLWASSNDGEGENYLIGLVLEFNGLRQIT
ncbi:hypothetical protein TL16_g09015 [Triparma laevis f. inornata]|uniref:Uncharacterized protein n=1 Tax=Triparma laevis f. inornata TaxID=1714386 RepID=A0A9W7B8B4_9STRA|nr:hypothetical protein TL16_g09015 [Triparma laevis f. inornata]